METPLNSNIQIVGIQQDAPEVYSITISTYTNIGYSLDIDYGGYQSLGTVTYNGQKYEGIELRIVADSSAELPHTEQDTFIVPHSDPSTIGIYVR